jgi:DNA helicase-2/ATP-dependent DNA helicase PcrA
VKSARQALAAGTASGRVTRDIVERIGLRDDILAGSASNLQSERRMGNVESLLGVLDRHDARSPRSGVEGLAELVRFLALSPEVDEKEGGQAATLSTMHGAKGLEYEVVFIAGLEEGLMPHSRSLDARATDVGGKLANDVEEERRLFYVSITRAKDRLYLSRARVRSMRGKMVPRTPSRFLSDITDDLTEKRDILAAEAPKLTDTAARGAALLASLGQATRRSYE